MINRLLLPLINSNGLRSLGAMHSKDRSFRLSMSCISSRMICGVFVALGSLFVFSSLSNAETVLLKSGRAIEGNIQQKTEKFIQMDVGLDFPITYYMDEIKEILIQDQPHDPAQPTSKSKEADQWEQQGLALIDEGKVQEGLELLRQSIDADPQAHRHFNLGAVLSGNAVALFKHGDLAESKKVFAESEHHLQKAVKLFNPSSESILLSQAYFLLGEMYAQAYADKKSARAYFEKSMTLYSTPITQQALDALSSP